MLVRNLQNRTGTLRRTLWDKFRNHHFVKNIWQPPSENLIPACMFPVFAILTSIFPVLSKKIMHTAGSIFNLNETLQFKNEPPRSVLIQFFESASLSFLDNENYCCKHDAYPQGEKKEYTAIHNISAHLISGTIQLARRLTYHAKIVVLPYIREYVVSVSVF